MIPVSSFHFFSDEDNVDPSYTFSIQQKVDIFHDCFAPPQSHANCASWIPGRSKVGLIASATSLNSCHSLISSLFSTPYSIQPLNRSTRIDLIKHFCSKLFALPPPLDSLRDIVDRMEGTKFEMCTVLSIVLIK